MMQLQVVIGIRISQLVSERFDIFQDRQNFESLRIGFNAL